PAAPPEPPPASPALPPLAPPASRPALPPLAAPPLGALPPCPAFPAELTPALLPPGPASGELENSEPEQAPIRRARQPAASEHGRVRDMTPAVWQMWPPLHFECAPGVLVKRLERSPGLLAPRLSRALQKAARNKSAYIRGLERLPTKREA